VTHIAAELVRLADAGYSLASAAFVIHARKGSSQDSLGALELAALIDRAHEVQTALYYVLRTEEWQDDDDSAEEFARSLQVHSRKEHPEGER